MNKLPVNTSRTLGFTLVEMLIAVGVISVLSLAFLPSFTGAYKQKALAQATENLKNAITTVRNRALTETGNPGQVEASRYNYAGIKFTAAEPNKYITFRSTEITADQCNSPIVVDTTKTLPSGIEVKIPSADAPSVCVFFEYRTGNAFVVKGGSSGLDCAN